MIVCANTYNYRAQPNVFNTQRSYNQNDSDTINYRTNTINTYRTLTPSAQQTRYNSQQQVLNDGYDTDNSVIKTTRQIIDTSRRAPSRNAIQLQQPQEQQPQTPNFYYRSITPYNQQYRTIVNQNGQIIQQEQIPQQYIVTTYQNGALIDDLTGQIVDANDFVQHQQQQQQQQPQFVETVLTQDGRQILLSDLDQSIAYERQDFPIPVNTTLPQQQQQSMIIQQQIAPSAYNNNNHQTMFQTNGSVTQLNTMRDQIAPGRLASTSSATNISMQQQQQQQQNSNINLNGNLSSSQQFIRQDSRRSSATSLADTTEVLRNHPKSVKTTQNYWYKPKISREEAINLLKDKPTGTFLIRDSNNFPGAYGLALKVEKPPPNVQIKPGADPLNELVRHFLIEPTTKGVKIKGCCNEPVFGSLAALVYQHSLTPLALPIKLILPSQDLVLTYNEQTRTSTLSISKQTEPPQQAHSLQQDSRHLLEKGAACNVYLICSINVDSRNGMDAITYALSSNKIFLNKEVSQLVLIQFKVTSQGITLTDLNRKKFVRQHFAINTVVYCACEEKLTWPTKLDKIQKPKIFGIVTKPLVTSGSNECHLFVEIDPEQPAVAIVDFINRYLIPSKKIINN